MNFAAIAWILIGAVFAVYLAQVIRVWVALKELRKLPNLVVIHRDKPTARHEGSTKTLGSR